MPTMKPVICQLLHSLVLGGAEVLSARLARQLAGRYRFVFACLDELGTLGEQLQGEGFLVEVLGRRPCVDRGCMRRLREFCRREGVEVVHAHQYTPFFYALAARGLRRRPPVFFTEHGRWFPDYPRFKRILFNRLMLRRTDHVIGVGEAVRQALIRNEGIPASRVGVIYNGVDSASFNGSSVDRSSQRRELGLGPDDFVMVQVARLDHLKDHVTAVRTIERVARRVQGARLVLVGEGPEREEIEREIAARNMGEHVRMVGRKHDVTPFLRVADVFLLTSISEGIPVTVLEAMAAGLPVVSTDVGGVAEIVLPESTAFLAPSGDDAALAEATCRLAEDRLLRCEMGALGRRRVTEAFSQQKMHEAYQKCYDRMLSR